jgi:hypothetical protein
MTHDPGNRRDTRRRVLRRRAILTIAAPPLFDNTPALVIDITSKGVGLLTELPLETGVRLSLVFEFGHKRNHRTIAATVVHAVLKRRGSWRVGCTFDIPLEAPVLRAFLRHCSRQ